MSRKGLNAAFGKRQHRRATLRFATMRALKLAGYRVSNVRPELGIKREPGAFEVQREIEVSEIA